MDSKRYQILVVDDEIVFRTLISATLEEDGYGVVLAQDGAEATEVLAGGGIDLVLTDMVMPRMGGLELLRHVRRHHPQIPVVIVTGFATLETALAAIREGVYDYVTKPFQIDELRLTVRNAVERLAFLDENRRLLAELEATQQRLAELERALEAQPPALAVLHEGRAMIHRGMGQLRTLQNRLLPFQYVSATRARPAVAQDLATLDDLHRRGTITSREFETLKDRILEGA